MDPVTPVIDTPVTSAPETAPAAPAISAPVSTPTPSARPTSMLDALTKADAASQVPVPPAGVTAATVPPGTQDPNAAITPTPKGPIPFEVHHTALENARTKATNEAQAQFEQRYPGLNTIDPQAFTEWKHTAHEMSADPIGWTQKWLAQLESHPTFGPQLRSSAGRILGNHADPEPQADVQIVNELGQVTGMTYSAKALAERDALNTKRIMADVSKELQPIKAERERQQAAAEAADYDARVTAFVDSEMGRAKQILENDDAMFAHVDALMTAQPQLSVIDAALQVRQQHLVPQLEGKAQQKALDVMKQKAAGTTANGLGASATPKRPTTRAELAALLASLDANG